NRAKTAQEGVEQVAVVMIMEVAAAPEAGVAVEAAGVVAAKGVAVAAAAKVVARPQNAIRRQVQILFGLLSDRNDKPGPLAKSILLGPKAERDLLNEVDIYRKLAFLQGIYLPRLLGSGYSTINFVIILELAGPVAKLQDLSVDERWKIVKGLQAIHDAGVLHNDIRQGNILEHRCQDGRREFRFVDFAWAENTTDKAKLDAEMDQLKKLLDLK
ncbi:hypothetical protein BGZ82_003787, partial [Podila clonocystis]